ncbi:N-acetylated-alpha-linked acidic dipeptidase 2-like isoform X2 [Haliotis rufescens]|uniref:N-acetylated-alpha-linked acidic dipeptidase 2-like isoform X1 n=1 Tax=Haliotis rufescens TaxID=6454 RepID=UPI00201F584B|nr:N-acetylated-alpha-linked acidic dipeptidase 2-like isoform X1 [Haliotis rufescens]XP_048237809.1 N-acetylated-alpha-linked acidic dipeptidase 2-like isoform X2 [Haliotis rufescens]
MQKSNSRKVDPTSRWCLGLTGFFTLAVALAVGILVGKYALCPDDKQGQSNPGVKGPQDDATHDNLDIMMEDINPQNIEKILRNLSLVPHLAGQDRNQQLGDILHSYWSDIGLDEVKSVKFDVLLSYPSASHPNQVFLLDKANTVVAESPRVEKVLTPGENSTEVVPPFLAYSKAGSVQGSVVYVNYGRVEDYEALDSMHINVTGSIVIARYGKIYRGDKVMIAEKHGAIGVILYSDPWDYRPAHVKDVYPKTWWLPPTGAQRGSVYEGDEDPLTPGYPATEFAYRIPVEDADPALPGIPAHVVGYGFAEQILREMDGRMAPIDWRAGLNLTYRLGPYFSTPGMSVRLNVTTSNVRREITDVIGVIRGEVEPDRYILIGNHRDAWVFGAMDPSSGTAIMMEMSRALMHRIKTGNWRPKRTIIFCSWDAEEYALIGSSEFVQKYVKNLLTRAVAYLNVDIAVEGNYTLDVMGTPLLYQTAVEAAKRVRVPDKDTPLYDQWRVRREMEDLKKDGLGIPSFPNPGSGSDYTNFLQLSGVPILDFRYIYSKKRWRIGSYPLYHTEYETFYAVKNFVDPEFKYHRAVGQVWMAAAYILSETCVLPFNVSFYAWTLRSLQEQLVYDYGNILQQHLPDYARNLTLAVEHFSQSAAEFMTRRQHVDQSDPLSVRRINDQMLQLERAFLDPNGIPGRSYFRHILFAPSSVNSYAGSSFPGLTDLLFEMDKSKDPAKQWERVKQHFSVILFTIQSAASTLKDPIHFL